MVSFFWPPDTPGADFWTPSGDENAWFSCNFGH